MTEQHNQVCVWHIYMKAIISWNDMMEKPINMYAGIDKKELEKRYFINTFLYPPFQFRPGNCGLIIPLFKE